MLVTMENQWRVPEPKDYQRMLKMFQWANHAQGKRRCMQGLMHDVKLDGDTPIETLDPEVISSLFKEAQEKRQPEEIVHLAELLERSNVKLDRFKEVGVIFAYLHLNQAVSAFARLVDYFDAGHTLHPRAHDGIAAELSKHVSSVDESYFLLESRKKEGRSVPLPAINMIIEACALMDDLDRAFATWAEIEQFGLASDVGTFNALLHTCCRTREIASGRRLLTRMAQDEVAPDADTFMHRCLLHVISQEAQMAHSTLQQCKDANLTPNARMYMALVNLTIRMRDADRAHSLLESMRQDGHRVSDNLQEKVDRIGSNDGGRRRHGDS